MTVRNLLILAGIVLFLVVITAVLVWLSGSDDSDEYYTPTSGPSASDRAPVKKLDIQWKLLGQFTEHECVHPTIKNRTISCFYRQRLSFDEESDSLYLSKYFPEDHTLKSEKLEVGEAHKRYM